MKQRNHAVQRKPWLTAAVLLSVLFVSGAALAARTVPDSRAVLKVTFNKALKKPILTDGRGRTLYMLTLDTKGLPTCEKADPACPALWPAFTSKGAPVLGPGLKRQLVAIVKGAHDARQVSYNRHPLYYYASDAKPGQAYGQGFYNLWYVLSPKGVPIKH